MIFFVNMKQQNTQLSQEMNQAQHHIAGGAGSESKSEKSTHAEEHEEWILLCQLNPRYTENTTTHNDSINWAEAAQSLPSRLLRECPS